MDAKDVAMIITACAGLVSAMLSGFAAIYAARAKAGTDENAKELHVIKVSTDGMKDELLKVTGKAQFLEGEKVGRVTEEERAKGSGTEKVIVVQAEVAEVTAQTANVKGVQ